jgi:hypothetical protein
MESKQRTINGNFATIAVEPTGHETARGGHEAYLCAELPQ